MCSWHQQALSVDVDSVPEHASPQKRLTVDFTVRSAGLDLSDTVPLEFKHQVLKSLPTIHTGNTSDDEQPWNTGDIFPGGRKAEDGRIDVRVQPG